MINKDPQGYLCKDCQRIYWVSPDKHKCPARHGLDDRLPLILEIPAVIIGIILLPFLALYAVGRSIYWLFFTSKETRKFYESHGYKDE